MPRIRKGSRLFDFQAADTQAAPKQLKEERKWHDFKGK
jgi:hypothetical protein